MLKISKFVVLSFERFVNQFTLDQYKFGEKSINNRLNMEDTRIYPHISHLTSYFINKLQLIESANCVYSTETFKNTQKVIENLIMCFEFTKNDDIDKITDFANSKYFHLDSKANLLKYFKTIELFFDEIDYSKLKQVKHSFPFCKEIKFKFSLSKEYEIITNPILYQNGVETLKFESHDRHFNLSDKFISNIKEIKPKSVYIEHMYSGGKPNFIDILSEFPRKMKITFIKNKWPEPISLWFSNTVLKIFQDDRDGFTLFEWKSFKFDFRRRFFENTKGEPCCADPHSNLFALSLDNYDKLEFEDFNKISNTKLVAKIDDCFPECIPDSKSEWTVFILAKDLIEAKLNGYISFSRRIQFGFVEWLISNLLKLKSYILTISLPWDPKYITNIRKLPHQNMKLVVSIYSFLLQLYVLNYIKKYDKNIFQIIVYLKCKEDIYK